MNKYAGQTKALLFKNWKLQSRQTTANICAILYPLTCLGLLGCYQVLAMMLNSHGSVVPSKTSMAPTFLCAINGTQTMCGEYEFLLYTLNNTGVDPDDIGYLLSNGSSSDHGVLSNIKQRPYNDSFVGYDSSVYVPFFQKTDSPQTMENLISDLSKNVTDYNPNAGIYFAQFNTDSIGYSVKLEQINSNTNLPSPQDLLGIVLSQLNGAFLAYIKQDSNISISVESLSMEYFQYPFQIGDMIIAMMIPFYFSIAISWVMPMMMYSIVTEKITGSVVMMQIMGLSAFNYFIIQYGYNLFIYLISAIFCCILAIAMLIDVFWHSNPFTWIALILLNGFSLLSFSFFCAGFFKSARMAQLFGYFLVAFSYSISADLCLFVWSGQEAQSLPYYLLLLLFPPFTFTRGLYLICLPFIDPTTLQSTIYFPLYLVYSCMVVQTVVYLLVSLYMDRAMPTAAVLKNNNAISLNPLNWLREKINAFSHRVCNEKSPLLSCKDEEEEPDCKEEREHAFDQSYECRVRVAGLYKIYQPLFSSKSFCALDNFCLTVKEGECLALLGPNGAGKSTLCTILVGLNCSSVVGKNSDPVVLKEKPQYCGQYDILWADLTVKEHIQFYCRLKGITNEDEENEVNRIMGKVSLFEAENRLVSALSGGMKRRLSLAISLIGNPKVLILDECTTGLDPVNRNLIWNVIQEYKEGRAIIFTTHNMEEAEALSTKIAIMKEGKLNCIGTLSELKNRFAKGYNISFTVYNERDEQLVYGFMQRKFKEYKTVSRIANRIMFQIDSYNLDIQQLLGDLETDCSIGDFTIHKTSLQDIFIKINQDEEDSHFTL